MTDILTITLNPALDMSSEVNKVEPEAKLRCAMPEYDPGGGGVNVARAVVLLGGKARAFFAVGGYNGRRVEALVHEEGVLGIAWPLAGETRLSLAIFERASGLQYRFVMPGPVWRPEELAGLPGAVEAEIREGGHVVLSGSQPSGVPVDFPQAVARMCAARGARLVVDTSGPPLHALIEAAERGLPARPHVLRLDQRESAEVAGRALTGRAQFASLARDLVARGVAEIVVLAMGAEGSVMASAEGTWHGRTPPVPVRSKVGAGDSSVGALTLALSRGASPPEALRHAVAAGSAAVMSDATDLCQRKDHEALLPLVEIEEI